MIRFSDRFAELCESGLFCFSIVVAISFLTVLAPVLIGGLHSSGDLGIYLGFAQEIRTSIENGNWFPGWANDNLGFGSVGIRFYPPVSFYTSALLSFVIGDWYYVVCSYFFLWMVPGCWGIYVFLRQWVPCTYALLGSVLYAFVPFHLAEIYQFSLYAEFAAGAILPYCFLYATRVCREGRWPDIVGFTCSCALLVLTHIPTTIIGAVSLGLYILLLTEWTNAKASTAKLAISSTVALLASSFYWVPVVSEVAWVAHNQPQYSSGLASYTRWLFPHVVSAAASPDLYAPVFRSFDAMIVITGGFFLPTLLLIFRRSFYEAEYPQRLLRAGFITGIFGIFMLSHASEFVWASLETLQKIQFPWRWLTVVSVLGTITLVLATAALVAKGGRHRAFAVVYVTLISGLVLAYDVRKNFMRPNIVTRPEFEHVLEVKNAQAGNSFAAWWPVWARPDGLKMNERVDAAGRAFEVVSWNSLSREIQIDSGAVATATLATFYYPHWKATINGEPVATAPDENGLISVAIPTASAKIHLRFEEPAIIRTSAAVSIVTWIVLAGLVVLFYRRRAIRQQ